MQQLVVILPIVVSLAFWSGYHYHKDRHLPEPPGALVGAFLLGVGANWLSQWMYYALEPVGLRFDAVALGESQPATLFLYALLAIGPIEEFSKLLPFLLIAFGFRSFDEPLDGIVYASFIGLGYACMENLHYADFATAAEFAGRAFASPVVHMMFASIWGHRIARARFSGRPILWPASGAFILAAVLHGFYDFLVMLRPGTALPLAALLIAVIWIWRLIVLRRLHREALLQDLMPDRGQ